jgi:hypothetical protein
LLAGIDNEETTAMRQPRYPTVEAAPTTRELNAAVEKADSASAKADSAVQSVTGSAVDNTDPKNPVINGTGGAYPEGASFPASPGSGDKFYRNDLNLLCYYDGVRWLSAQEYTLAFAQEAVLPITASNAAGFFAALPLSAVYLTRLVSGTRNAGTNNGSNYWTISMENRPTGATIASFATASDTSGDYVTHESTINAAVASSEHALRMAASKVGSPGSLYLFPTLYYRRLVS